MPIVEEKKEQISLRIKPRLRERLVRQARRKDIEVSEYMRQALLRTIELDERKRGQ